MKACSTADDLKVSLVEPMRTASGNRLLSALGDADWQRWRPQLACVNLERGQVLHEAGLPCRHIYFPTTAVISLTCLLASGDTAQIAIVGHEGLVGESILLQGGRASSSSVVLIAGQALRMGARAMQDEFDRSHAVKQLLLRYVQALATQVGQTAICNRHHSVEQQLCGFLLHTLDRLRGIEVEATQDLMGAMLGVRRSSVTHAARHLQEAGLIHYARGHVFVSKRAGLEQRACECHALVKKEYDRLLPEATAGTLDEVMLLTRAARQPAMQHQ